MSFILISSIFFVYFSSEQIKAAGIDIYVDDDQRYPHDADGSLYNPFKYIQDAIDAADDGDTIKVLAGIYPEELIIDKSVTITSEDKKNTIIFSGLQNAYLIDIVADSVSLEHFTIQHQTTTSHRKAVVDIASEVIEARIHKLSRYYKRKGVLPKKWKYVSKVASIA